MSATHLPQHVNWERIANWSGLLVLLSLAFVWPVAFAIEPGEVQSGSLLLKSSADAPAIEAIRVHSSFRAEVTGNVARVQVEGGASITLPARVVRIGKAVRSKSQVQPIPVVELLLEFPHSPAGIRPGQQVRVVIDPDAQGASGRQDP